MYRRIIVPLDGSALAEQALAQATELSGLTGAPVHLLRVVDYLSMEQYGPYALALEYATTEPVLAVEQDEAKDYLGGIETRLTREGLTVATEVRQGRVAGEIIAAAQPGDVIVMASHGRGGLSRWLLGSIAENVVRHATVPVLLVHAGAEPAPSEAAHAPAMATAS
jgi:nucleotide-binding universal stress UspA family protein